MLALMATCKYCSVYGTFIGSESLEIVSITAKNQAAVAKILKPTFMLSRFDRQEATV